ncbi:hypothetical protein KY328_00440 [Candidatus Woesearchaeota archaeon]|nr:hypothetical protein [Candidatus Woesearchaeota archaeon]MBW3021364.1 hypothetical protein [Candidatus Woesearchaeota archaeon]
MRVKTFIALAAMLGCIGCGDVQVKIPEPAKMTVSQDKEQEIIRSKLYTRHDLHCGIKMFCRDYKIDDKYQEYCENPTNQLIERLVKEGYLIKKEPKKPRKLDVSVPTGKGTPRIDKTDYIARHIGRFWNKNAPGKFHADFLTFKEMQGWFRYSDPLPRLRFKYPERRPGFVRDVCVSDKYPTLSTFPFTHDNKIYLGAVCDKQFLEHRGKVFYKGKRMMFSNAEDKDPRLFVGYLELSDRISGLETGYNTEIQGRGTISKSTMYLHIRLQ